MEFLSSFQGHICHSDIQKSACNKVIWFTIWNVFFATVFSGSAFYKLSVILDPKEILFKLAVAVPAQASFFIAYVVTTGWTDTLTELFRVVPFMVIYVRRSLEPTEEDTFTGRDMVCTHMQGGRNIVFVMWHVTNQIPVTYV